MCVCPVWQQCWVLFCVAFSSACMHEHSVVETLSENKGRKLNTKGYRGESRTEGIKDSDWSVFSSSSGIECKVDLCST